LQTAECRTEGQLTRHAPLAAMIALALLAAPGSAGSLEHTVTFLEDELIVTRAGDYDAVRLAGCDLTQDTGRPELPLLVLVLALPPGARPTGVEIVSDEAVELAGPYLPRPAQPPRILPVPGLDLPERPPAPPDASVYGGTAPYPGELARLVSGGRLAGSGAAGVLVHPVQFLPETGALRLHTRIVLRVEYEEVAAPRGRAPEAPLAEVAAAVFANRNAMPAPDGGVGTERTLLEPGDCEYVLITPAALESAFAPLAEWKTRKGVPARIVTAEWIAAAYAGPDAQARIRSFITDAHAEWGTSWVLLGGDTGLVPTRRAYAMTCEAGAHPDEDAIACDLYFSDLDGTWDADGDATYGETSDEVDLYPDVFVGRASVTSAAEAQAFVTKVLEYERTPAPGWFLDMLLAGEILWTNPYTDSGIALDAIDRDYVPPRYDPIAKLYESLGNESVPAVISALNGGKSHFLHSGHAWYDCMGCGTGYLTRSQVDALTNEHEQPLVYSIGCWPAAFDLPEDCIAERFIRNPHGGAVAFIGNSRYGWASPGNPGYGYSERFMQQFYKVLYVDGITSVGAALATAKAAFVPLAQDENVYRWHEYEVNLLGDPETRVWTDDPATLTVQHPAGAPAGPSQFNVSVSTAGRPIDGARVCVMSGSGVYERALTGPDGSVSLPVAPAGPDSLRITVTAANVRPYEAAVPVAATGAWLSVESRSVDDASGNSDGLPGPGESVGVTMVVSNRGADPAHDVQGTLSCDDPWVTVTQGAASFGDFAAGDSHAGSAFSVSVAAGCPNGHVALLTLSLTSVKRGAWSAAVPLTIAAPVLHAGLPSVDDGGGDGDGVLEPGEQVRLLIEITNTGLAAARSPVAVLTIAGASVSVTEGSAWLPTIPAGASRGAVFEVEIEESCPTPGFPTLAIEATTSDGFVSADTVLLIVGETGIQSDFEAGSDGWTSGGTGDTWHLSSHRSHSGLTSWYCGSATAHLYADNMNSFVDSPPFVLAPEMELSFWCWHEVPIYGEDGLFLELVSNGQAVDTLDFIGSGGALGTIGTIGNGWLEHRAPLEGTPGDTVRVRFRFSSNASVTAEGFYIDDVAAASLVTPPQTDIPDGPGAAVSLGQNRPNPFAATTAVAFTMERPGRALVVVYSPGGRLVRTLYDGDADAGEHVVLWDGTDDRGGHAAAGIYLCRLAVGNERRAKKIVLVR
jgi:hypothetical protein